MAARKPQSTQTLDDIYARLIEAHEGLSREESEHLNAKLVLILAAHLGNVAEFEKVLKDATESETS